MPDRLSGARTFLITGASQGLGRSLAEYYAEHGRHVILAARDEAKLREVADRIAAMGSECSYHVIDLRDVASLETMTAALDEAGVGVDVLINNAADVTSKPFADTSLDEMDSLVRTNVLGPLQLTRLALPLMSDGGVVVNVSSLAGYKANPTQTVYSISKGAVNAMSEALNAELRRTGIRFVNVALASVGDGPGRVSAVDVARRIEAAIAQGAHEVYFSPVTKWLMRFYRFCPWLMRRTY